MAFTVADVTALETAIASGAKSVRMNGRTYEYQSTSQMTNALSIMRSEVLATDASANNKPRRSKMVRIRHNRGLD